MGGRRIIVSWMPKFCINLPASNQHSLLSWPSLPGTVSLILSVIDLDVGSSVLQVSKSITTTSVRTLKLQCPR